MIYIYLTYYSEERVLKKKTYQCLGNTKCYELRKSLTFVPNVNMNQNQNCEKMPFRAVFITPWKDVTF